MGQIENVFPDSINVRHLRKKLWTTREFGRAAVMIGSGFSKLSVPVNDSAPELPTWSELVQHMRQELGGGNEDRDPLLVAEEYRCTFKDEGLDKLLQARIPDGSYRPGDLHRRLLELPWSDVFTTNYDTLLERAAEDVVERRYEVIRTAEDLVGRLRPRIVKLHGSLPSSRPFIVTREDFRKYPRTHPAFINTVQQSIMENAFCLLGFSGDDPNFLAWTGWVRDNLGPSAPPIYFCGVLDLTPQRRSFLEKQQHVIPIDLGPLFPRKDHEDPKRHALAMEWLLHSLKNGEPRSASDWPTMVQPSPHVVGGKPVLPPDPGPLMVHLPQPPNPEESELTLEEFLRFADALAVLRRAYPGWVVCPFDNRTTLWWQVREWLPFVSVLEKADKLERLRAMGDVLWAVDRCLRPHFQHLKLYVTAALKDFPALADVLAAAHAAARASEDYAFAWRQVVTTLARQAREDLNEGALEQIRQQVAPSLTPHDDLWNQLHYEAALLEIQRLRPQSALKAARWNTDGSAPIWLYRKAALLAELGVYREARELVAEALRRMRTGLRPDSDDLRVLSAEGWMMLLERILSSTANTSRASALATGGRDRWVAVDRVRASPFDERERFSEELRFAAAQRRASGIRSELEAGDPEAFLETAHLASGYLRFRDEAALPYLFAGAPTDLDDGVAAVELLTEGASMFMAIAGPTARGLLALARFGAEDALDEYLSRTRVASMRAEDRHRVADLMLEALREVLPLMADVEKHSTYVENAFLMGLEVLSRVVVAADEADRLASIELVLSAAVMPALKGNDRYEKYFDRLYTRVLPDLGEAEQRRVVERLLQLPLPTFAEVDPFTRLDLRVPVRGATTDRFQTAMLLDIARGSNDGQRVVAIRRLFALHRMEALSAEQTTELARVVWARAADPCALSRGTELAPHQLLTLPAPEGIDGPRLVKRWAIETPLTNIMEVRGPASFLMTWSERACLVHLDRLMRVVRSVLNPAGLPLDPIERRRLLEECARWSKQNGQVQLDLLEGSTRYYSLWSFRRLSSLTAALALEDERSEEIASLLWGMRAGLPDWTHTTLEPVLLSHGAVNLDDAERSVLAGLGGPSRHHRAAALRGIHLWALSTLPWPPSLIDALVNQVTGRRIDVLGEALDISRELVVTCFGRFTPLQLELLDRSLDLLLTETNTAFRVGADATIPDLQRPDLRVRAARLAAAMHQVHATDTTRRWEKTVQADPLPEVRKVLRSFSPPAPNPATTRA